MNNPAISAVIITHNEEDNISKCLSSLTGFDEIIVVDSGSKDKTIEIANTHGAKVIHQDWLGFGPQKKFAVAQAKNNWIFSIDADEYLSDDSRLSILNVDLTNLKTAYALNRRSFFLGKEVKHSGWNPDWVIRLFNRSNANFTDDLVHERVTGFSTLHELDGLMFHNTYPTKEEIKNKTKKYGLLGQRSRKKKKNRYFSATWAFLRTYLIKAGFLDGITGFKIASMNAKTTFIKYS
mgnify:CR=1 FL=1